MEKSLLMVNFLALLNHEKVKKYFEKYYEKYFPLKILLYHGTFLDRRKVFACGRPPKSWKNLCLWRTFLISSSENKLI